MYSIFVKLLNMSIAAGILAVVVMALRVVLKKVPRKYICVLWAFVALRLICPFGINSALSVYNAFPVETDSTGQLQYFQYNGKSEKSKLVFETPALAFDDMSEESTTVQAHTSDLYLTGIVYIWLIGASIMLIYAGVSYLQLRKRTSASILFGANVYVCDEIASPFILGFIRPHIFLPDGLDEKTKISVIAHEQAHLKRRDHWWKPLGYFLLSLHWFNPVLWMSYIFLCRDIETACDEKVVDGMDKESVVEYTMAMLVCASQRRSITACPIAFGETNVKGRVKNVLNYKKPALWVILIAIAACVAVAVCFLTDPKKVEPAITETPVTRVVQAVVTAIGGNTMMVRPVEGSWELKSSDIFTVSMENLDENQEPQLGDTVEIMYGGTIAEVYPAELENIMHIHVTVKAGTEASVVETEEGPEISTVEAEEQPLLPYQAAETVPFAPDEIHDVIRAEVHESYGDFAIVDEEKLKWLENTLQDAKEVSPTGCPFGTVLYIFREDGTIGTIEPAEDGCKIYRSGEKYYELNVDSTEIFNAFGIEP